MSHVWRSAEIIPDTGLESSSMSTAIATCLTLSGFVIAADGLQTDEQRRPEKYDVQKIFPIPRASLAYCLYGYPILSNDEVPNEPPIVDLVSEMQRITASVSPNDFQDGHAFAEQIGAELHERIASAKRMGLKSYPKALFGPMLLIQLLGYWDEIPLEMVISFYCVNENIRKPAVTPLPPTGKPRLYGSPEVCAALYNFGDARFARFRTPNMHKPIEHLTLEEAIELAKNYILACDSEEGRTVDPFGCRAIGGNIHIGTITHRAGFEWVIKPTK